MGGRVLLGGRHGVWAAAAAAWRRRPSRRGGKHVHAPSRALTARPRPTHPTPRMRALLQVPVPTSQVLAIKEGLPVELAARHYEGACAVCVCVCVLGLRAYCLGSLPGGTARVRDWQGRAALGWLVSVRARVGGLAHACVHGWVVLTARRPPPQHTPHRLHEHRPAAGAEQRRAPAHARQPAGTGLRAAGRGAW